MNTPTLELERETLAWVNDVRNRIGAAPLAALPRGRMMTQGECPIARAFSDIAPTRMGGDYIATTDDELAERIMELLPPAWDDGEYHSGDDYWSGPWDDISDEPPARYSVVHFDQGDEMPTIPEQFAAAFDSGQFPHLIDRP